MNKKLNTVLFMLGATVANLLIMLLLLIALGGLFLLVFRNVEQPGDALATLMVVFILLGSIAGTFLIYNRMIKWVVKKWDLEKYIEPVFRSSQRRR